MNLRNAALAVMSVVATGSAHSATLLSEGFDSVASLSGWATVYNGTPTTTRWTQGNVGIFAAQAGAPNSYIADSVFTSTGTLATSIDNYLITPTFSMASAFTVSFYANSTGVTDGFPDSFQVLMSTGGISTTISDFSTTLGSVASVAPGWTLYTYNVAAQGAASSGRLAFRYLVPNTDAAGDYFGIDTVLVSSVPEPGSIALMVAGLALVGGIAHSRRKATQAAV